MRKTIKIHHVLSTAAIFGILLFPLTGSGQVEDVKDTVELENVVITGTKYEIPVEKSGKSIYKLTEQEIKTNAGKSLADLLNEVPGIHTDGNFGTPGTNISYFVRGGKNRHTLILIDGVPVTDPSGINLEYDLRLLSLNQVKSIEILRGGLSTLYGTGAAASVINIQLKKPIEEKVFNGSVEATAGSFNTFSQNINLNGKAGGFFYLFSADNITSEGFSSALDKDPNVDFDDDGFSRQNGLIKLGYDLNENWNFDFHTAYKQFEADFDGGAFFDSENNVQDFNQLKIGFKPEYKYQNGNLAFNLQYNDYTREFKGDFPSESDGDQFFAELTNQHIFSENIKGLFGLNFQRLSFDQGSNINSDTANFKLFDPYASLIYDHQSGLNIHAGLRLNNHSEYGVHIVYNLNPSYLVKLQNDLKLKVRGSISTAFISPSLFQLFSTFGNTDLEPEESLNYEGGLSLYLKDNITFNGVYFMRKEEEPIDFVPEFDQNFNFIGGSYQNVSSKRDVYGFETDLDWKINQIFRVKLNYSFVESDEQASLLRIPNHKLGIHLNINPVQNTFVSIKFNHTGKRNQFDFSNNSEVTLEDYQLIDIYGKYDFLNKKLALFGAVNNLFDEDFIGVVGFTTRGRNFSVGARYSF